MGLLTQYLGKKISGGDSDDSGKSQSGGGLLSRYLNGKMDPSGTTDLDSYHKGGKVKKTGPAMLKKGERVLTKPQFKKLSGKKSSRKGA